MTDFVTLDEFDRRLLARARRDNQEPARVTAQAVGLSESAVLRRMRRLRHPSSTSLWPCPSLREQRPHPPPATRRHHSPFCPSQNTPTARLDNE